MTGAAEFSFRTYDRLSDDRIELRLVERRPAEPERGYVPEYRFAIVRRDSGDRVGEVRLRVGDAPSLLTSGHIGYEVDERHRGHGFAARACRLVRVVALDHGVRSVVITCDPTNLASRRTIERIGGELVGEFDVPADHPMYAKGRRRVLRYRWHLEPPGTDAEDRPAQIP